MEESIYEALFWLILVIMGPLLVVFTWYSLPEVFRRLLRGEPEPPEKQKNSMNESSQEDS